MANVSKDILLGDEAALTQLYTYPNIPEKPDTLSETILHWFRQTLVNDGVGGRVTARVAIDGSKKYRLSLEGPAELAPLFDIYANRLPAFLTNGWVAYDQCIPRIKADGLWDPNGTGWRFFLPHGLAMASQMSIQLFHFPPRGLLNPFRNYLTDPVPIRWEELLVANGHPPDQVKRLETVIDAAPIAAKDEEGTEISRTLQPTDYFKDYHLPQLQLLANVDPATKTTSPLIALGAPARALLKTLFGVTINVNQTARVEKILAGYTTWTLAANHPYYFYIRAQGTVGTGVILPTRCAEARGIMIADLVSAGWQSIMARNPGMDSQAVINERTKFWDAPEQKHMVCALTRRHGSLYYPDLKDPTNFEFKLTLDQALAYCTAHGDDPCAAP